MSSPSSSGAAGRLYLNCSFDEKDEVKRLGALWDASQRQWYIAPETPCRIFAKWLTKAYLDCPYADKDQVKRLGAKWDASVKRWYVPKTVQDDTVFAPWLGQPVKPTTMATTKPTKTTVASPKNKKTNSKTAEVAVVVVNKATLPRISADMTVKQLHEECLARNPAIKGVGSKDKTWLLNHLQMGSVWISAGQNNLLAATPTVYNSIVKKKKVPNTEEKRKQLPNAKESMTKKAKKDEDDAPSRKPTAKTKRSKLTFKDLQSMPRVFDTTMTLAQLSAELLARQPAAKGLSNKTKDWFVEQLGEGSIWTTAPGRTMDWTALSTISDQMTLAQLKEELLARQPTATGLSNKTKDWFMQRLGAGSIWMTSLSSQSRPVPKEKPSASPSSPSKKKVAPAGPEKKKTTKVSTPASSAKVASSAAKKAAPVKKEAPVANQSKVKPTATSFSAKVASSAAKNNAPVKKESPVANKRKAKPTAASAAAKSLPPTVPKDVKVEKQKLTAKPNKTTKSAETALPTPVLSRSSLHAFIPDPVVSQKGTAKQTPLVKIESSTTMKTSIPKAETKERKPQKTSEPERNGDGLPIVSSRMTTIQLKEELLVRDPNFKGYSKMKSVDFLTRLGIGSVRESHPESRQARLCELRQQHSISSTAHVHPMADSSVIRCSVQYGTQKRRVQVATCDHPHSFATWCQRTPHRSCAECDFDLCQVCYEIECLPEAKKQAELNRRYDKIAKTNAEAERRYEEEQMREIARQETSERLRKEEFERKHAAELKRFPTIIRNPPAKHLDENNKLEFTVWTSCSFDYDGFHWYAGPPAKEFNSSYATIEEANRRVEFVFLFNNPWEWDLEDMHYDENFVDASGFRRMEVAPKVCEEWTVSVVPSQVFEVLD